MRFHPSADRHGIDRADAEHVAHRGTTVVPLGEDPVRTLVIGFDRMARPLEVVVMHVRGEPVLIHAMRLRAGYYRLLKE